MNKQKVKEFTKKHWKTIVGVIGVCAIGGCVYHVAKPKKFKGMEYDGLITTVDEMNAIGKIADRLHWGCGRGTYTLADLGKYGQHLADGCNDGLVHNLDDEVVGILIYTKDAVKS